MTRFLTTTATAIALCAPAFADNNMGAFSDKAFDPAVNIYASDMIGMYVYATEADIQNTVGEGGETEWDNIGDINEIVLNRDGTVEAVIVGVGGFLGMGEKDVAVDMSQIKFVSDGEDADEYFLVVNASAVGVEEAPVYERYNVSWNDNAGNDNMHEHNDAANEVIKRGIMNVPTLDREGYATANYDDLNTEDLTGARVYGINDEDIGEISELLLTDEGKLDRAVVDVGGFLGMGEHSVALPMDKVQIMRSEDGDEFRVYVDNTEDALKKLPEYNS